MLLHDSDLQKRFRLYGMTHCYVTKARVVLSSEMLLLRGLRASYMKEQQFHYWMVTAKTVTGQERVSHKQEYKEGDIQVNLKRRPAVYRCEILE